MTGYLDAHHHLWVREQHPQTWMNPATMHVIDRDFDEDAYAAVAPAAGVTASIVVQTVNDASETAHLLQRAERAPLVAGVVGWADLTSVNLADKIARWREGPGGRFLVGLRHVVEGEPDPDWLRRGDVQRGLRTVGEAGLVYDLLVRQSQVPAAIDAARAAPDTRFVLDHLGKPPLRSRNLAEWAARVRALGQLPNVSAKVSGLVTEADWASWTVRDLAEPVNVALETFGPERLMFGSDWPVCLLAASYPEVVAATQALLAALSPDEHEAVFARNARDTYQL